MSVRERGATVGMMWVIILIVLLLAAAGWGYSRDSDSKKLKDTAAAADRKATEAVADLDALKAKYLNLSNAVGFKADQAAYASTELLQNKLTELKAKYPNDLGADDRTLAQVTDQLSAMYDKSVAKATDSSNAAAAELTARGASDEAKSTSESTLQAQITTVNTELRDERDRASNQKTQDDGRIAALQGQLDESNAKQRTMESDHATEKAKIVKEKDATESRVAELVNKVKVAGFDSSAFDEDGTVVSVGKATGTVYLDIGSKDLLRRGVKFAVFRHGKGGSLIAKGALEVREVYPDSSVCAIVSEMNPLDPISPGDVVANPLFSKTREKVFVLLGNFPVYGKNFLEKRIRDIGAEVDAEVTTRTDFVVLGDKGPEEGAVDVTELPEFKKAQAIGVQVLRMSDIENFIKN